MKPKEQPLHHLIDSVDWTTEDIKRLWALTRHLKAGKQSIEIDTWFHRKCVILAFSERSTRTRLTLQQPIVEMGGVPLVVGPEDIYEKAGEHLVDFARAMAISSSAICMRLSPSGSIPYGHGEKTLRSIADVAEEYGVPVISLRHDRCHPCQGLYEALTFQDALRRPSLAGTKILYTWVRGSKEQPWSPTQDSLMLATRLGMEVTLCNPPEYELDPNVIGQCRNNAEASGGTFKKISDFENAFANQEIVYARHWGSKDQQSTVEHDNWYLDEDRFGRAVPGAFFIHPMPLKRNDEVDEKVADGCQSLLTRLVENKYYLQKAVLLMASGYKTDLA